MKPFLGPVFRLMTTISDIFFDKGDGTRQEGDSWVRTDTHELKVFLGGKAITIANSDGVLSTPITKAVDQITRTAAASTGEVQQIIGLGFRPSMVVITGSNDANSAIYSDGWTDGSTQTCKRATMALTPSAAADLVNTVNIQGGLINAGWTGIVATTSDGFSITWTKIGAGLAITLKYLAIK